MIRTYLTNEDIINEQPSLVDRLQSTQTDFTDIINKAYGEVILDIKNMNYDLRKLGISLIINPNTINVTNLNPLSDASSIDYVNMSRVVVNVASIEVADDYVIALSGCDTIDGTYTDIIDIPLSSIGVYSSFFYDYYKYYKTKVTASLDTIGIHYESSLIETVYFYLHLYKTIADIYSTLQTRVDDFWESMMISYTTKYNDLLSSGVFYVDIDDDKKISKSDASSDTRTLRISL